MNARTYLGAGVVLLLLASVAQANAGTPLMWATLLHLVIGNLFIGVFEGVLLAKLFGLASWGKTVALLIGANYFSVWIGGFLLDPISKAVPMDINNLSLVFWGMVLIAYLITLGFEFPFVALAFRGRDQWLSKSIKGSLVIQTASYVLLFGWYWLASGTSLLTNVRVVEPGAISVPDGVVLYYISAADGDVYARRLSEPDSRAVFDLNSTNRYDRLYVRPSPAEKGKWDLVAMLEMDPHKKPYLRTIRECFASVAAVTQHDKDVNFSPESLWFNSRETAKLGDAHSSDWEFWSGFWAVQGIRGTNKTTNATVRFSLETPFAAWPVRNATHLPTDKVLLQLGSDQICLYEPLQNRIALIAKGRGPIAVMEDGPNNRASASTTNSSRPK